eukprot:COSAG05_NODE_944_length_6488_cov_11.788073_4_plen_360_part_00
MGGLHILCHALRISDQAAPQRALFCYSRAAGGCSGVHGTIACYCMHGVGCDRARARRRRAARALWASGGSREAAYMSRRNAAAPPLMTVLTATRLLAVSVPTVPFEALWNSHWPHDCESTRPPFGGSVPEIDFASFSISINANASFSGSVVSTLYGGPENQTGLYPYISNSHGNPDNRDWNLTGSVFVNGGLPQHVDMDAHLARWRAQIQHMFPDPSFSGVVGLDWEAWYPLWGMNAELSHGEFAGYNQASLFDVQQRFPSLSLAQATARAKEEYDTAGVKLMVETIKAATNLRPHGKWGFFGYPDCRGNVPWTCFRPPDSANPCPQECKCPGPGTRANLTKAATVITVPTFCSLLFGF